MAKFKALDAEGNEIEVDIDLSVEQIPQDVQDQIIKKAQGISYGNIDSVASKYGFEKQQGEKTSDFIDRIFTEQKTVLEELKNKQPESSEELKRLQTAIADQKQISDRLKADLEAERVKLQDYKQSTRFDSELSALDIAVPSHIQDEEEVRRYKTAQIELIKSGIKSKYSIQDTEDGSYRIQEGTEAVLNSKNELASIHDVATRDYKAWLAVKQDNPPATGGQGKPKNDGRGGSTPKTFEDITAMASEKNLTVGSSEWAEFVNTTMAEHGIED